jgi:hypothetical protein
MALKDKTGKILSRSEGEAVMKSRGAITITIYAALLAICTLLGNSISSRILTDNIQANDAWSFYQAKTIKEDLYLIATKMVTDNQSTDSYNDYIKKLEKDRAKITEHAHELEADRDEAKKRSPFFSFANTILQIAIVLSTTAILAVSLTMWYASIATGIFGIVLMCNGIWYFLPL